MTNFLTQIPEQWQAPCSGFLLDCYREAERTCVLSLGIPLQPDWASDEEFQSHLFSCPLAGKLALIAQAAVQALDRSDAELWEHVQDELNAILATLFLPPGSESSAYRVPEDYWQTEIGRMFALARIWLDGDQLITIAEAAQIAGVSLSTMASRVNRGKVRNYPNPRAKNPQKAARLVVRTDLCG